MNFRAPNWKALLLAGLLPAFIPLAQAQSTPPAPAGQQILFSTPAGETTSNAPLPVVQAPQSSELVDTPDAAPSASPFSSHLPQVAMPAPQPVLMPENHFQDRDDFQDPMDPRERMKGLTAAQIMGVPTMEQIFGLHHRSGTDDTGKNALDDPGKNPSQSGNGATNILFSDGSDDEPDWAKTDPDNLGQNTIYSNKTEKSSSLFGGFFDSARNDDLFGNHNANSGDSLFGPQNGAQQSQFDSTPSGMPSSAGENPALSPAASPFSSGLNPQPPTVFSQSSLETLPQAPQAPIAPGQNYSTPPPAVPSWEPKPPPWTMSGPAVNTMGQRKF